MQPMLIMITLRRKSWFAEVVRRSVQEVVTKTAKHTALTSSNTNADSAVLSLSGIVGAALISARDAIRNSVLETMFQGKRKMNFPNVEDRKSAP